MGQKIDVDVILDGKKYTLQGTENPEFVQKVVSHVNDKIAEFRNVDSYNLLDKDTKNLILAVNLSEDYFKISEELEDLRAEAQDRADEFFEVKQKWMDLQAEYDELKETHERTLQEKEFAEKKILTMQVQLDQAKKKDNNISAVTDIEKRLNEVKKVQEGFMTRQKDLEKALKDEKTRTTRLEHENAVLKKAVESKKEDISGQLSFEDMEIPLLSKQRDDESKPEPVSSEPVYASVSGPSSSKEMPKQEETVSPEQSEKNEPEKSEPEKKEPETSGKKTARGRKKRK